MRLRHQQQLKQVLHHVFGTTPAEVERSQCGHASHHCCEPVGDVELTQLQRPEVREDDATKVGAIFFVISAMAKKETQLAQIRQQWQQGGAIISCVVEQREIRQL